MILRIDSPGGTTAGSEAIYEEIRKIAKDKPVVAVMDTVAASGGYITAIAADHIVARGNTITGSIGVIFTFPEVSKLLDTLGIKMEEIKSGDLKAEPSPYKPVSDKARAGLQWRWCRTASTGSPASWPSAASFRHRAGATTLADGRVYTGRQAVTVKLIDALGGEEAGLDWLADERTCQRAWRSSTGRHRAERRCHSGWASPSAHRAQGPGLRGPQAPAERAQGLTGLLVLWHPQLMKLRKR